MNMHPMTPEAACRAILKYARAALASTLTIPPRVRDRILHQIADTLHKNLALLPDGKARS